ncbi:ABC transporter ATP-binding protein [Natronoglycomyces albus]|uniref:ATP-binding cassette domain-containing protein n=1 Tax=Natronoglycomyces albus TaxID=2811108 RepID=A0A895XTA5_9ACTN|nr:ATP-binding cassette domain-containing protein [Natronoglycomyces albus]QSB05490.1 ATP-binding cassette domain-containing protein [Natronoglycomyces albus]
MITFADVAFRYHELAPPVFSAASFTIEEGELCLIVGPTGSGKSTLLGCVNGLVPHFTGGIASGSVTVGGRDISRARPSELADLVGYVPQDPLSSFVTDEVELELAYTMEQLALSDTTMRKRVTEIVDLLSLSELRTRALATLSAGQRQRVAIGAALTAGPRILVLDEPTSALDPGAAEEVLSALHRLVHDLGITVLLAEHRLERVVQYADSALLLQNRTVTHGPVADILATSPVAPPVVRLGREQGWQPLPISIRSARRVAADVRAQLDHATPPGDDVIHGDTALDAAGITVDYPGVRAVNNLSFSARRGERVAIMGRNGCGKSSLLWALQGTGARSAGSLDVAGADPATLKPPQRRTLAGLVPSEPGDLLYAETVERECVNTDRAADVPAGTCRKILEDLIEEVDVSVHPRDLSEGQRLALALAVTLTAAPPLLLLDEPTRGLDYPAKAALARRLHDLADAGHLLIVTTHDVEFVAEFASRVAIMSDGEIVADGPAREVVAASPMFAPQVAKILPGWLTVEEVREALR